ncbi:KH domain-containing protein [bacterium]|nr:KH domain-containing protein [bacterium]
MGDKDINSINEFLKSLLESLDVSDFDIVTTFDSEENLLSVEIEGEDFGNLIGYHGENIFSIQSILYAFVSRNIEGEFSIFVDIGGYRKDREDKLRERVKSVALQISSEGGTYKFPPMKPVERRVIHTEIALYKDVVSFSIGEDMERRVVVSKSDLK